MTRTRTGQPRNVVLFQAGAADVSENQPVGTGYSVTGVRRPGRDADHSHPYNAKNKNEWSHAAIRPYAFIMSLSATECSAVLLQFLPLCYTELTAKYKLP